MNIIFLGSSNNPLINWLKANGENLVYITEDKLDIEYCKTLQNIDFVISYNYKHIIKQNIIDLFPDKIINLHISYLPYNRGAMPNFWSFFDTTPAGVTIHFVDVGLDTGNIIVQKLIKFENLKLHTFLSTYNILQTEIQNLFKDNWNNIKKRNFIATKQDNSNATFHYTKDFIKYEHLLPNGWNTKINDFLEIKKLKI